MSEEVPGGYHGKLLRVDLSNKSTAVEPIDATLCRRYLGGAGFVGYYLWKEMKQGADALGPDNKLVFALGPVSGLQFPGTARHCVGAKSPLTGGIAKAEVGGFWAAELKRAGFDVIIVEGKSDTPVYLFVQDGEASIRDASSIWGKETKETQESIRGELNDPKVQLALIGPGGENMVLYACIMHGLYDAAGRGGLGAVMGSKNLKAIAVRGHNLPEVADNERVKQMRQGLLQMLSERGPMELGTGGPEMMMFESSGNLPIRNFRDGAFPEVQKINAAVIKETVRVGMESCYACPQRCKKVVQFDEPYHVDAAYGGPEYETLSAFGSNCGVGNLKAICKANELCGAYSLDTISTGGTIAFAMECYEKGLITGTDTGGIDLKFGNDEAMLEVIGMIARRDGIGDMLAEGTARMAKKIGKNSADFAMQVKGLDAGQHEPRISPSLGLGFMVNPHGADHCCNLLDFLAVNEMMIKSMNPLGIIDVPEIDDIGPRKVALFRLAQLKSIIQDSLVGCMFVPSTYKSQEELLSAVTGWDTSIAEQIRIAERIMTVMRLFNIREGLTANDDVLPERFFQPKTEGGSAGKALDKDKMEKAKHYYYTLMGWDTDGVPLPEKVEELYIE
jgi:aldehyde:ferredoxin oxidoreductase